MNELDLKTKIEGLEKAIKEHQDFVNTYSSALTTTKQELVDLHKPELTPTQIDAVHQAIEDAVESFDFDNTDNYDFEYGMEYDGKVYCETIGLQCAYDLTEKIVNSVMKLFKEADCPEDDDSQLNTETVVAKK